MTIIGLLVMLVVVGLVLYLMQSLPIDNTIKTIIKVVVILVVVVWLLESFGAIGPWPLGGGRHTLR